MLQPKSAIILNEGDSTYFNCPIDIKAKITYTNGLWEIEVIAEICSIVSQNTVTSTKMYKIPSEILGHLDKGDGKFWESLGYIIESFIAEDLMRINPEVKIEVQL